MRRGLRPTPAKTFAKYPQAKQYKDFRVMLDQQKDIDAVIVATPDHTHAVIAMAAIERGKHVYVQKPHDPLASTKPALLTEAARKHKVATQMGNQGHSGDGVRLICEWICGRGHRRGPRGPRLDQPARLAAGHRGRAAQGNAAGARRRSIGTCGSARPPMRPYHPTYHPGQLAGVVGFRHRLAGRPGLPHPRRALLGLEAEVSRSAWKAASRPTGTGCGRRPSRRTSSIPRSTIVRYKFPAREGMPEVKLTWWDGGMMPPRPEELEEGRRMGDDDGGVLFLGDKGTLMCGCYGQQPAADPRIEDEGVQAAAPRRSTASPAARTGTSRTGSARARAASRPARTSTTPARLSEMVLMGNLAVRFPNRRLLWDGEKMEVTNDAEANAYVRRQYRQGWTL